MKQKENISNWLNSIPGLPYIMIGLASVSYVIQVWIYSQNQRSLLDEGNFLYKGYLFVTGKYIPFQEYGTWTNKMPLSFLVPGFVQRIFGIGLATARSYAVVLAILILIGAVILGLRLGGKWGGAITAVLMALNPATLKIYGMAFSEGLAAFLLVAALVLILGKDRPLWQLLMGAFLAGVVPVTRINLFPVLPLVILYLFWEHGSKKGLLGLAVSLIPFVGLHLYYWPGITQLWSNWIPDFLRPLLGLPVFSPFKGVRAEQLDVSLLNRFQAFFQAVRMQFPAVMGGFVVISLWPKKWNDRNQQRVSLFLLITFGVLFLAHFGAAILLDFNVFAFFRYINFFYVLGIVLIAATWKSWQFKQPLWKRLLIGFGILISTIGIAVGNSEVSTYYGGWINELLRVKGLTFENGRIMVAPWKLWEMFKGLLGWEFPTTLKVTGIVLFTLAVLVFLLLSVFLYNRIFQFKEGKTRRNYLSQALVSFLLLGTILSPTEFFGGGWHFYDCQADVFGSYQNAAEVISKYVHDGDQVFWIGVDTQAVLLELLEMRDYEIYPQQLNSMRSFRLGGDSEQLTRIGFWNDELAQDWIDGSQVMLFERQAIIRWFGEVESQLDLDDFEEVGETAEIGCQKNQRITIYRKR